MRIIHLILIMVVTRMPNRKAKDRKWKKRKLNEKWKKEGRTANQHKKWLEKNKNKQEIVWRGQ